MRTLYPRAAVDAQAAAAYAKVDPDTIRQWRHRGLITSCGGTPRRPLYRLDDLDALLDSRAVHQAA